MASQVICGFVGRECAKRNSVAASVTEHSDQLLIAQVVQGDEAAYRQLVERHSKALHAFVYRLLANAAETEEVTQETFLRLWKNAETFGGRSKLKTWLYRIAHNLAIDRLRKRREVGLGDDVDTLPASSRAGRVLAREHQSSAIALAVVRGMAQLPDRQRAALSLVHYDEMSHLEASDVLGVSVRALESLIARGRNNLRSYLSEFKPQRGK